MSDWRGWDTFSKVLPLTSSITVEVPILVLEEIVLLPAQMQLRDCEVQVYTRRLKSRAVTTRANI